jgi:hypothetical protein
MTRPLTTCLAATAIAVAARAQIAWGAASTAVAPPSRSFPALAYDSVRGRTVLFGGNFGTTLLGDTWEFSGTAWLQVAPAPAPMPRSGHALVYDCARARTVLFGGASAVAVGNELADTWEYDGATWVQVATATTPAARAYHALAYDLVRRRTVLFGGSAGGAFADTWEYDGTQWSAVATVAAPPARLGHALAYHSSHGRSVLFGGITFSGQALADTWLYDGVQWTSATTAAAPSARWHHRLAYDNARGATILFGGWDLAHTLADTWTFDGAVWTQATSASTPPARWHHAMAYDSGRGRVVLFGGTTTSNYLGDTWELAPPATSTWARFGLGCPGSAGVPALDVVGNAPPRLNSTWPLQLTALPPQPGVLALLLGFGTAQWNGSALPFDLATVGGSGCLLWLAPATSLVMAHPGGSLSLALAIPNDPALAGLRVALQACVFDQGAGNGLGAVSNAGIATLH